MNQKFGDINNPNSIIGKDLDEYLQKGWFRMGQTIFTCNFLNFNRQFYSAIWLRIALNEYQTDNTFKKLQKLNKHFQVNIRPATITTEKEELYHHYKTGITFETSSSLADLLLKNNEDNIFNTFEVCIYDDNKLIACGYFDMGEMSAAGIVSFYDPTYKKYSLGKYLIYSKIDYCKNNNLQYFYPGYFAPNYPAFNYKLKIGSANMEFLNLKNNQWQDFNKFSNWHITIDELNYKLLVMEYLLYRNGIKFVKLNYEFYNANSISSLQGMELFDYPIFIFVFSPNHVGFNPIIVFDLVSQQYRAIKCVSVQYYPDYVSADNYFGSHIMKINEEFLADPNPEAFIKLFEEQKVII